MLIEYDRFKFPRSRGAQCGVLRGKARLKPRWGLEAWDIGVSIHLSSLWG